MSIYTPEKVATTAGLPASLTAALLNRLTGQVAAGADATRVATTAPYTGGLLADLPVSTPGDVEDAFVRARRAQTRWAATPIGERRRVLLRFHDLVLARQDEGLDLMQAENGKTRRDAFLEITDTAITSRYYARSAEKLLAPRRRRGAIPLLTHTTELHHPKGVVAIISPWNYPLSMAAGDAIPALMAGNAVVQKPDTQTALTALWAMDLMYEAGLPADVWQMVVGRGSSIGEPLMDNADYVMFTGSTATGRRIARDAGERLIGASLELGGKNAMLVLDDADLDRAADGAVAAAFPSAGQLCVSIERIYVAESVREEFVTKFVERTKQLKLGAAYDYSTDVGSLTTQSQLDTVTTHVADAVGKGATVLAGGSARPDLGPLFYEPTILADVTPEMTLHGHETFGPVVSIYGFHDVEEGIAQANATSYGLNASVWSRNGAHGRAVAARVHAGTVNVNEAFAAAWGSIDSPMGGMGDSGVGRRHGKDGLLKYTEPQTVAHQRALGFTPPAHIPWTTWAPALSAALRVWKRIGAR
ncbi:MULTISPECIES: succinic semialdehyde dehydrogenase [Rhodococcus]|uniref:succinate-semialdehyde dehydrogenase (NADP(+)) n=1 Tax=Rhodococcus oxybenzonivorans TaxID=1990687 RepID=A0AAE5A6P6_9NOCA|nr:MULTISPECIES: succinic semialdehyde dehydrogenase [Rhodococcus]MDV7245768.1 succinic semialdehyde dehydrogenase [Rhodococcus oxybenzonivorans]MDV7265807.1 succinic semialdehyde dehydrogenase [Rhodococcus oxybenzonivorans]MDV7276877.1 succinic semialdehyde dehydrogenase [Rhodococcus oxybenzonivorans]MDV7336791.1 succinic semialdehyde dehydrogenase [Rhodococcus oxybenzonivorans]MDV7346669.1 succinic semialdehyde dehydrogenase [Rhodococcus oxybenzonivorans]